MSLRSVARVAGAVWLLSCGAKDDMSAMVGDYERPSTGSGDKAAELHIGRDGMSATDAPFSESLAFDRVTCEDKLRCRVSGSLCSAALEKRPDGNILVSADSACHTLSGLWLTKENAERAAPAQVEASATATPVTVTPASSAPASAPASASAAASASASASPTPTATVSARPRDPFGDEPSGTASAAKRDPFGDAPPPTSASARPSRDSCMRKCTRTASECSGGCGFRDDACVLGCEKASIACMQGC